MSTENPTPQPGAATVPEILTVAEINKLIPHRYPFLFLDRVEIFDIKHATGIKCLTVNEEFFQGHFPGRPIMPGVLILEAMAQTGAVLLMAKYDFVNKMAFFLGIDNAKFRAPVTPGMVLRLNVEVIKVGGRAGKFRATATVDGKMATEAEMSFAVVDR
ncbi:MAG: 3-hydroxyacyl-ACP dehydratase FabZ [Elusimicrobiota bacterium]